MYGINQCKFVFKLLLVILFSLSNIGLLAQDLSQDYTHANYKEAMDSSNKLLFKIKSTKLGLITTTVEGVVLNFKAQTKLDKESFQNLAISFDVSSMNTDNGSRDEKMHDYCLDYKKTPKLSIMLAGPVQLGEKKEYPAIFNVRGKDFPISVTLDLSRDVEGKKIMAKGLTILSFKNLSIPDPSIAIASVDDKIEVEFTLTMGL